MRSYPRLHHNVTPVFPSSKTKQWPPALSAHTHSQRLCPRVIYSPSVTQTHWPWQISQFISWLERRYTRHEPRVILDAPFQARSGTRSSPDPLGLFRNNSPIVRESACTHAEFEAGCVSAEIRTPPHGCLLNMQQTQAKVAVVAGE